MNKKILIICGPTGVGKTKLALKLAKKFNGELVSADSRQVYKDLNIITGKDIPKGSRWSSDGFWQTPEGTKIWGLDLIMSKQNFSVAQYKDEVEKVLKQIYSKNKLPIIVGGTGLYIKVIVDNLETIKIPPNPTLRKKLSQKSAEDLYKMLYKINPQKAKSLNNSDKSNPRRLIRAIEISKLSKIPKTSSKNYNTLFATKRQALLIGLESPLPQLQKRVRIRIQKRLKEGAIEEIKTLLNQGISWQDQSMHTLGVAEFRNYFNNNKNLDLAVKKWEINENKYIKRQLTWFKKDTRIEWFDTTDPNFSKKVEDKIYSWHNKITNAIKFKTSKN